ncbi:MAG: TIR domain-containing protein [Lachnospiraceae bacterium]|nr:TIR domain-containing protein [Lachnospiraceae bacterium]
MRYDAFISYRHAPLDMEFAKKVHTGLETYHVPAAVQKKTGKKKIQRVFRDQEELPIGSDLNDNIASALRESEYLIVICSPETPGSYWVSKEIETFIEMHDRQHVLAILVDGEPEQSFPPMLLVDESGNTVEPLAADVRGTTPAERNRKFKTELLRLAAPILGCTYDDLRQRHRERILKRNLMVAGVAAGIIAVAGAAFGVYNARVADRMKKLADEKAVLAEEKSVLADDKTKLADEKTKLADEMSILAEEKTRLADEILAEYREKQVNQSRFYAEEAMLQLAEGFREDAVLIASAGLPSEKDDRPFVAEAEYALAAALHVYDCGNRLAYDRVLKHELTVSDMTLDKSLRYLTSFDDGNNVYVWNSDTGELLCKIPPAVEGNRTVHVLTAFADANGIVIVYADGMVLYDYAGTVKNRLDDVGTIYGCAFYDQYDMVICYSLSEIRIIALSDFTVKTVLRNTEDRNFQGEYGLSKDGRYFAMAHKPEAGKPALVTIYDLSDNSSAAVEASEEYIFALTLTEAGNLATVSTNYDFIFGNITALTLDVARLADGERLYDKEIPLNIRNGNAFRTLISSHSYQGKQDVVIAIDSDVYSFDEVSGDLKAQIAMPGMTVTLDLVSNSSTAYIGCRNGEIIPVNTDTGRVYSDNTVTTVSTGAFMEDMKILNGGIVFRIPISNNLAVMRYHMASDLKKLPDLQVVSCGYAVAPDSDYYVLIDDRYLRTFYFYDRNGDLLYTDGDATAPIGTGFFEKYFVIARFGTVNLIDPKAGTIRSLHYEDLGASPSYTGACVSADGQLLALYGSYGVAVIDLREERCIYAESSLSNAGAVAFCGDSGKILVSEYGEAPVIIDLATGTMTKPGDSALSRFAEGKNLSYLACSDDGAYAAISCRDGNVRILALSTGETVLTIPLSVHSVCFLGFTKDGKHIILEGDDYQAKIYNIADGTCVNSIDVPTKIAYMIEDGEIIALCDNYTVSLVDAKSFGRLAYVPDAITYLAGPREFLLADGTGAWFAPYKDYKALLAEAQKQFPGAELTAEKKVEYNID